MIGLTVEIKLLSVALISNNYFLKGNSRLIITIFCIDVNI